MSRSGRVTNRPVAYTWSDCGQSRYGGVIEGDYMLVLDAIPTEEKRRERRGEEKKKGEGE